MVRKAAAAHVQRGGSFLSLDIVSSISASPPIYLRRYRQIATEKKRKERRNIP
jgi:hypothetical protein